MEPIEFQPFPKIARLSRDCIVTEKIDGTNAQISIGEDGEVRAGSRTRWIEPGKQDNYGFAGWVRENRDELLNLGPGTHFGEWWGQGIQRRYGQESKRFSLFNVTRWGGIIPAEVGGEAASLPKCCRLVPVLYQGPFDTQTIQEVVDYLAQRGSHAAPGFMQPEGVVIFHIASGQLFKKTILNDEKRKNLSGSPNYHS
jgi:hypothetical protein